MVQKIEGSIEGSEDFATLLENYLPSVNARLPLLDQKGDLMNGEQDRISRLGRVDARRFFVGGLRQKETGSLEESYVSYETVLKGHDRLTRRIRHLVIKNLADICVQMSDRSPTTIDKIPWIERAYDWFSQLPDAGYEEEPPEGKLHTAVQFAKLKLRHHLMVEPIEEKRKLLLEAYASMEAVRDIIPSDRPTWQFAFHSAVCFIARDFCRLTSIGEDERKTWLQRWFGEAQATASVASPAGNLRGIYLASAGYAAEYLGNEESDGTFKLQHLRQAYELITQSLELGEDQKRLVAATRIASRIAQLEITSPEARIELLKTRLQEGISTVQAARVAVEQAADDNSRTRLLKDVSTTLLLSANTARELTLLATSAEVESYRLQQHDLFIESAEISLQIGEFGQAAHSYSLASQISEDLAGTKMEPDEIILLLERCADERSTSAELAIKASDFRHAAFALGLVGKIYQRLEGICLISERQKWVQKAHDVNYRAGELWQQMNDDNRARNSFRIASIISERLTTPIPETVVRREIPRETFSAFLERVGIQMEPADVVKHITAGGFVVWDRISPQVKLQLLEMVAGEIGLPASAIGPWDFFRPFSFLDGKTLGRLYAHYRRHAARDNRDAFTFLFEETGITIPIEDTIKRIKLERRIRWGKVPYREIAGLLQFFSTEVDIPLAVLRERDFRMRLPALNNRRLMGLYNHFLNHPNRRGKETMAFMFEQVGITVTTLTRSNYRLRRMQEFFGLQALTTTSAEPLTLEKLMPWVDSVSRLYQNPFLDISRQEIESELAVAILDRLQEGNCRLSDGFVENIHRILERYIRDEWNARYRVKSLQMPIAGTLTLGDVIGSLDRTLEAVEQGEEITNIQRRLGQLSPLQRHLIRGIAIEAKTFEEMATELGINVEALQDHYDDALILLRTEAEPEEQ